MPACGRQHSSVGNLSSLFSVAIYFDFILPVSHCVKEKWAGLVNIVLCEPYDT